MLGVRMPAAMILLGRADAQDGGIVGRTDNLPTPMASGYERSERDGGGDRERDKRRREKE